MTLYYCEICEERVRATKSMRDRYEGIDDPVIICQICRYKKLVLESYYAHALSKVAVYVTV